MSHTIIRVKLSRIIMIVIVKENIRKIQDGQNF